MKVRIEKASGAADWTVWLDTYKVNFPTQVEAKAFVEQLQARLQAPHPLPSGDNQPIYERTGVIR